MNRSFDSANSTGGAVKREQRLGEVPQALENLFAAVDRAEKLSDVLQSRLSPVVTSYPTDASSKERREPQTNLAASIQNAAFHVDGVADRLATILDGLQI